MRVTQNTSLDMMVDRVVVEGCGCFSLHSKRLGKPGGRVMRFSGGDGDCWLYTPFRVKSLRRTEEC